MIICIQHICCAKSSLYFVVLSDSDVERNLEDWYDAPCAILLKLVY